jgi:heme exporter protein C
MTSTSVPAAAPLRPVVDWFFWFAVVAVIATYIRAIGFTPPDALQGPSQKIYYIHFGAVAGGYLAFTTLGLMSIVHLWLKDERADRLAAAGGEVAVLFFTVLLIVGSIYAKVIWGAWWVWELRLTLTLLLWFLGVGYLVMRQALEDPMMRARFCAVLAVLQVLLIPFIHLSVYIVRDHMHPMPIVLQPGKPAMPTEMRVTTFLAIVAFLILASAFMRARYRHMLLVEAADVREQEGAAS